MFHIALLEHRESAEDETGRFHFDRNYPGEAEADKTVPILGREKAQRSPGERQGAIFPPLFAVDVIGAGPAVNRGIPAHCGRSTNVSRTTIQLQYCLRVLLPLRSKVI